MRVLIVSSVPPTRCGIAAYAAQQASRLREAGHQVTLASLDGLGDADLHFRVKDAGDLGRLRALAPTFDRAIVHYQHDLFFDGLQKAQLLTHNVLLAGLFATGVEVVAHEVNYGLIDGSGGRRVGQLERLKWRSAAKVVVHTEAEEARLRELVPGIRLERRAHGADFTPFRQIGQAEARAELGLEPGAETFLCIGFLQRHKGFDRAMRAFAAHPDPLARLYVVGSARVELPEIRDYIDELEALARSDRRIRLVERFVSDAEFDTWIAAADSVVLPYREIWSSGVAARVKLIGRRLIAADVGGLGDQLGPEDVVLDPIGDLTAAFRRVDAPRPLRRERRLKVAFVAPWYAPDKPGGAERVVRETAERLNARGFDVEVFTTRIRDYFSDWSKNALSPEAVVAGVPVHRFDVGPRDAEGFERLAVRVRRGEALTSDEEVTFFAEMLRAPALTEALARKRAAFDLFVLPHYMFSTTVEAARVVGDRAVLMPFLHDEGYARLPRYAEMFRGARGGLFMSGPEAALAQRLFGLEVERCAVVGTGVEVPRAASRHAFARRHGPEPYLVYVGRKDAGKNFPELLDWFRAIRPRFPGLRLVTIGAVEVPVRQSDGRSIYDLGLCSDREKFDAIAGSVALVNPSKLESFSLSLMEAWLVRRPAIVQADCPVTADHLKRADGGFAVRTADELGEAVAKLLVDPALGARFGRQGRAYVERELSWETVMNRTVEALVRFSGPQQERRVA